MMDEDIMNKLMVIYLITNKVTNKQYVGQTTRRLKTRIEQHLKGDLYIDCAIRKYGWENFTVEVIEECKSIAALNEREIYWIAELGTLYPNGYNMTEGGRNGTPAPEVRQKNSESHRQAYKDPAILARHSAGQKRRFERPEERQRVVDFMTGREMPQETRDKISNTLIEFNADPVQRQLKSERSKEVNKRPEVYRHNCETLERVRNDPEIQQRRLETLKATNAKPEVKQRRSEGQKRRQAREKAEREAKAAEKVLVEETYVVQSAETRAKRAESIKATHARKAEAERAALDAVMSSLFD